MSPAASSRWCPTPEQLMMLEELYRTGIRTPNASQIQRITAHLSLYGKIEGKNVFYWFQNHKARDRQKLRRKFIKQLQQQQQQQLYHPLNSPPPSFFHPHSPAFFPPQVILLLHFFPTFNWYIILIVRLIFSIYGADEKICCYLQH